MLLRTISSQPSPQPGATVTTKPTSLEQQRQQQQQQQESSTTTGSTENDQTDHHHQQQYNQQTHVPTAIDAVGTRTHILDYAPAPGWTVHVGADERLFYCNHITRTAGWLPPAEAWKCAEDGLLPYGWERAIDDSGRQYYINHVNKTTTYESPLVKSLDPLPIPEPRSVTLERSPSLGFGFVAGSEKPVIVRFVTEGGPSVDKLLPGDQILSVNGEDVKGAPREHVIALVRACTKTVNLVVCQPPEQHGIRKSTLLSASKRARLKSKPSRVRFAESVCVNGAPLFPPSAFSLSDICIAPMANVLKVFLENGQTKSFKYDAWTTVQDVVSSLQSKLCLQATEHFSLVVEHIKSLKRNKLTLLDPADSIARIASRPGAHKLRCLFRVAFVPQSSAELAQKDLNALDYFYIQCCNDVIQERFAPELQYDTALRLAALQIYQHALSHNMSASRLTLKVFEKEFGLERFVPSSLLDSMKRKEVRKLLSHFLKLHSNMAGPGKQLTVLQAKLHYLDIVSQLPSYGAKCFSVDHRKDAFEKIILVSPKFGISQLVGTRNAVPQLIANIEDMRRIEVRAEDEVTRTVFIRLQNDKAISVTLEERDACELVLVLKGYYHLSTNQHLNVDQEENLPMEDLAPPYLSQHKVVPEKWSYTNQNCVKMACFAIPPSYQMINKKTTGLYNTMGRQSKPPLMLGYSLDSNMNSFYANRNHQLNKHHESNSFDNTANANSYNNLQNMVTVEILENDDDEDILKADTDEVLKRVREMQQLVESSERYLTENCIMPETSVDIESDTDSVLANEGPSKLKHSDSLLLLLSKGHGNNSNSNTADLLLTTTTTKKCASNLPVDLIRSERIQSESDTDSLCASPYGSPNHGRPGYVENENKINRISFGLRSPTTNKPLLQQNTEFYDNHNNKDENCDEEEALNTSLCLDADIIDLTMLPPPLTPDELDSGAISTPLSKPPTGFTDSLESLDRLEGDFRNAQELERFLSSVCVPSPTQKVTPAVELTSEEIMSYIIPPPPKVRTPVGTENCPKFPANTENYSAPCDRVPASESPATVSSNGYYSNTSQMEPSETKPVIEYATVDRKSAFSCCARGTKTADNKPPDSKPPIAPIKPLPRRSSHEQPPERPPKPQTIERPRSHSLTLHNNTASYSTKDSFNEPPPKLPPRGESQMTSPPYLFLPPKKPPLPPVPPLEILRQKKNSVHQQQNQQQQPVNKTAGIGSPHLQRSRNIMNDLDSGFVQNSGCEDSRGVQQQRPLKQLTAVSTPTSPYLGRGAALSAVPIPSPDDQTDQFLPSSPTVKNHISSTNTVKPLVEFSINDPTSFVENNSSSTRSNSAFPASAGSKENLLFKTDVAMAGLLVRLDQMAGQCSAAQVHGGGKLISEEKFQIAKEELTSQSLRLVTSSKMLVIAMSDPSLPDLPENLAICLTMLRRLTELCQDLTNHTTAPLQTRNLILKVHDVISAFRNLITANIDRSSQKAIEEYLAAQAEILANVLATLLRSLRIFSP